MYRPTRLLIVVLLASSACGGGVDSASNLTTQLDTTSKPDVTMPAEKETTTMPGSNPLSVSPFYSAGDIDAGLQFFIDQATADLATRLSVATSDVTAHAAVIVTWSDGSLGCPQPGMSYAQVLTDGSVIELESGGAYYRYHTGGTRSPFLCQPPLSQEPSR